MNVFVPYANPLETAKCLDRLRLNKQVIECSQILNAIDGTGKGWVNHPVTKMYKPYRQWLYRYMQCLECYIRYIKAKDGCSKDSYLIQSVLWGEKADKIRPFFLTNDFCDQHKRRLFTKNPEHYKQFEEYGTSDENWYFDNDKNIIIKYINGKRI